MATFITSCNTEQFMKTILNKKGIWILFTCILVCKRWAMTSLLALCLLYFLTFFVNELFFLEAHKSGECRVRLWNKIQWKFKSFLSYRHEFFLRIDEFYVNYFSEMYENLFLSEISKNSTSIFKDLFLLQIFYPHILVQVLSYLCI